MIESRSLSQNVNNAFELFSLFFGGGGEGRGRGEGGLPFEMIVEIKYILNFHF